MAYCKFVELIDGRRKTKSITFTESHLHEILDLVTETPVVTFNGSLRIVCWCRVLIGTTYSDTWYSVDYKDGGISTSATKKNTSLRVLGISVYVTISTLPAVELLLD